MKELFGFMKEQILNLSEELPISLTGQEPFLMSMLMKKFTKTLLNIIQNFIPHKTIICDDRNPPWINKEIKKLMLEKNWVFKSYCYSHKSMFLFEKFKALQYQLNISIEESKEKYYTKLSSRLADPLTSPNTYWSILKTFLNNKKIPCIPPLFHENKFITDFKEKAELFNHFFVN